MQRSLCLNRLRCCQQQISLSALRRQTSELTELPTLVFINSPTSPQGFTCVWMQTRLGWVLSKYWEPGRCALRRETCQLAFPQPEFPPELQEHVWQPPHLSWGAPRVLALSCLNLHSAGVQAHRILAACLPAGSHFSKKKKSTKLILQHPRAYKPPCRNKFVCELQGINYTALNTILIL